MMPRRAVLLQLADAYEEHAEAEQRLVQLGRYGEASLAHDRALLVMRAYRAESDDPSPQPTCGCVQCGLYRVGVRRVT